MKLRRHKLKQDALICGVMLVATCLAPCEQKQTAAEQQTIARIEKRIEEAYDLYCVKPEKTKEAYFAQVRKILGTLSEDEIRLVAQHVDFETEQEAFRAWARFDPTRALKAVRATEDANADEIKLAGTGLEGGPGEAMAGNVFRMYLGAIDGWAEVAPNAAWNSFKKREGPLSNSLVIEDYLNSFYRVLFEHLAKVDPDLTFEELISYRSDNYEEMNVASMLGGYLRGAPRGCDWHKEANRLLERKWRHDWWLHSEIRTALMGRWLQDDAEAAQEWFNKAAVEGLKIHNDLGSAAGYWAARDFPAAWDWMKSYKGFENPRFGAAVLHGADVFLTRSDSYFIGGTGAQAFLLEQAGKLPNARDREACASMIRSAVANTKDLHGEPEKPNSSEQRGADQPATAPKSEPDSNQKPQPKSEVRPR